MREGRFAVLLPEWFATATHLHKSLLPCLAYAALEPAQPAPQALDQILSLLQPSLLLISTPDTHVQSCCEGESGGKVPVFDLSKRNGKVCTAVIFDVWGGTILSRIREQVTPDSIVYTDSFNSYNALDVSGFRYCRISHSELFASRVNQANGIENFWNQAKRHLRQFNGVPKKDFHLFIKECEWSFNTVTQESNYEC